MIVRKTYEHFTMIGFGGGAPLHACRLCEKLGIKELLIPPGAGVGSAIGFLKAPFSYEATRGHFQRLADFNPESINSLLAELEEEASTFVRAGAASAETQARDSRSLLGVMVVLRGEGGARAAPPRRVEPGRPARVPVGLEVLEGRSLAPGGPPGRGSWFRGSPWLSCVGPLSPPSTKLPCRN